MLSVAIIAVHYFQYHPTLVWTHFKATNTKRSYFGEIEARNGKQKPNIPILGSCL